jgi:hypothetical protein
MSNSEKQQTVSPLGVRQHLLNQIEASKQAIENLNDEELEAVAGGVMTGFQKGALALGGIATAGILTTGIASAFNAGANQSMARETKKMNNAFGI